jgi:predicted ribosomally synthesized peptide with nif11-like leader
MTSEIERLMRDAGNDAALRSELETAGGLQAAVERANARGYAISPDDVKSYTAAYELNDTQLDGVAGGKKHHKKDKDDDKPEHYGEYAHLGIIRIPLWDVNAYP